MEECEDRHQTFFVTKDSVKLDDPDAFFDYVFTNDARHLLNNAANKSAVKEYIEANNGEKPPGVEYTSFRDLNWRRGKGA